jgi:nitrogen fixation NifU-like protein
MTTVLAKGKSLQAAMLISEQDVINALEGLSEAKQHCSNLGVAALRQAIGNYWTKQG